MTDGLFTPKSHPSTWQAEVEALRRRVKELEEGIMQIAEIVDASEGEAARFYSMLAKKLLKIEEDPNS